MSERFRMILDVTVLNEEALLEHGNHVCRRDWGESLADMTMDDETPAMRATIEGLLWSSGNETLDYIEVEGTYESL